MSKGGEQEPEGPPPPLPCAAWVPFRSHITASQLKQTFGNDLSSPTEKSGGQVGCYCRVCGLSSRAEWGAATRPTWCFHSGLCPVAVLCHAFCCLRVLALWPLTCFILILVFCSVASVAAVSFQLPEGKSSCQGEGGAHVAHVLLQGGARDDVSLEMSQILFIPSAPCSLTHISWAPRQIRVVPEVRWFLPSLERLRGIKAPP